MKLIDTHLHFWDLNNNINNWVLRQTNAPFFNKNYLPEMQPKICDNELYGVVHVEAHDSAVTTITEIKWLDSIMKGNESLKYRHIAFADITLPITEFSTLIKQIKDYKKVIGIRHILSNNPKFDYSPCGEDLSSNSNIMQNLKYLAQNNLIFDCQMYPYQIQNIIPAITSSNVTTIIDHLALPAWNQDNDEDHKVWQQTIKNLSLLKNIFIKMSGLDMFKQEAEFDTVVNYCLENFPIEQLMYGSNYPVSFTHDYNYWYNYLNKLNLSADEKEQIFFKNAHALFFKTYS
ncbi:MAG: amidohydrolase [Burkholderiales bacterium]|jgi:predicted TIM-barrel fold metal-dependent hydrolase|nr:amidohydrolase [Burkholderiales bacterium]